MNSQKDKKIFWLEKFDSFELGGEDAKRFLNGMTTSNLNSHQNIFQTCWLTPKGGIRALLEIHFAHQRLIVIVLQGDANEIRNNFENMIFPSDRIELHNIISLFRLQEVDKVNSWRKFESKIFSKKDLNYYCHKHNISSMEIDDLENWKISNAFPQFPHEIDGLHNPLELGLTDLVDFNKGCYLGQETMARLKKSSSLKQEIRFWIGNGLNNYAELKNKRIYFDNNKEKVVGYITSFVHLKTKEVKGLAMVKKVYLGENGPFYNEDLGKIRLKQSYSSVFL
tara:strand:- start:5574 stop:6416 length:843 start_codon:yes stop_codon:yes gene_type:complete